MRTVIFNGSRHAQYEQIYTVILLAGTHRRRKVSGWCSPRLGPIGSRRFHHFNHLVCNHAVNVCGCSLRLLAHGLSFVQFVNDSEILNSSLLYVKRKKTVTLVGVETRAKYRAAPLR